MLFKRKKNILYAPLKGELISLNKVNDPVFAQGAMGKGCAIVPESGEIFSPCSGKVTLIAPTKHCIGITSDDGIELLLHFGIDSFKTEGKGFEFCVSVNEHVMPCQKLGDIDLDFFEAQKIDMTSPIIILNDKGKNIDCNILERKVAKGEALFEYTK